MSLHRLNPKRDDNEPLMVQALVAAGWAVRVLNGSGVPDLLCSKHGRTVLVEVKAQAGPRGGTSHAELTPAQVEWLEGWQGEHFVAREPAEILAALGAGRT